MADTQPPKPVRHPDAVTPDPALQVWLGLKLVLLSIFVALAALSTVEPQKARLAVTSLATTFGMRSASGPMPAAADSDAVSVAAAQTLQDLAAALLDLFPLADGLIRPSGSSFELVIPTAGLGPGFADPSARSLVSAADRLAAADRALPAGHRLSVIVLFALPAAASAPEQASVRANSAALAALLTAHGLPPEAVSVGVHAGKADQAVLGVAVGRRPPPVTADPQRRR